MPWARLDDRFHDNRKIRALWKRSPGAVGLHVMAITYCSSHLTDGVIDEHFVEDRVPDGRTRRHMIAALVDLNLWHTLVVPDSYPGCIGTASGWILNDYLDYNPTRTEVVSRREKRSNAGKLGASAKWGNGKSDGKSDGNLDGGCQNHGNAPIPTHPVEAKASSSGADRADKENEKANDDDRGNCRLFAELAPQRNPKVKIPKAGTGAWAAWMRETRLLRTADGNPAQEINQAIRWVFTDPSSDALFWGTTIQAPSGLREHFPKVWAKMQAQPLRAVATVESSTDYLKRRKGVA